MGSQIFADPKTRDANHLIPDGSATRYQPSGFRLRENSRETGDLRTSVRGDSPAALLVHQQQFRFDFHRHYDGLRFSGVELFSQLFDFVSIARRDSACPEKFGSSRADPSCPFEILFHRFSAVVKGNVTACEESLEIQLGQPCQQSRLAQSQPFNSEQSQREFSSKLRFRQPRGPKQIVGQGEGHNCLKRGVWLGRTDSNRDTQIQILQSYR